MKNIVNKCMLLYKKYEEIINYLIFGGLTTLLSLIVYYGVTLTFLDPNRPVQLQIANVLSWTCGFLFAYFTNRKYVFKSNSKKKIKEFISFFLSRISTLLLDMLIMYVFVTVLKYNDQLFKIVSQILVIVLNYVFSKVIVFKKSK